MITPSTTTETQVPAIPEPRPENVQQMLLALKEVVEVRNGLRGDPLDQAVTFRSLYRAGMLNTSVLTGQALVRLPGAGLIFLPKSQTDEYAPPPAPTGLTVTGALANFILTWNAAQYHNHAYTEVWRSGSNDLGMAVRAGTTESALYADNIGNTAQLRYYWLRHVSMSGVPGPFNATAGVSDTTLQVLTNHIADFAVTNAKIGNLAVDSAKIADAAIVTAKIADASITTAKIGTAQITTALIANAAITSALILDAAITTAKIGLLAVDTARIADAAIVTAKIGDAQITSAKINDLSANKINAGTLSAARIAVGSLNADKITANTIYAGLIISRSCTAFEAPTGTTPDSSWYAYSFTMDQAGIVAGLSQANFTVSTTGGITYTYESRIAFDTTASYTSYAGSFLNSVGPPGISLQKAASLSAGTHTVYVWAQHTGNTGAHIIYITLLKSYR